MAIEQLTEHGITFGCIAPDVVRVVRCKDCGKCYCENGCYVCTNHIDFMVDVDPDGYCSCGKRKEENDG